MSERDSGTLLRTFIAVELDEPARDALRRVQVVMQAAVVPGVVRWVAPENIHVTLKFLGDTRPDQVPQVTSLLSSLCRARSPFTLSIGGRGCFPNFRRPNVVWAGLHDRGEHLARLVRDVERAVAPLGWPAESRPFRPHLTLGRVSKHAGSRARSDLGAHVEALEVGDLAQLEVRALYLIRSELYPTGPVYSVLATVPFGNV